MTGPAAAIRRALPMLAVMVTIFFLSHQPSHSLSLPPLAGLDKLAHLAIYGLLAGTVLLALPEDLKGSRPGLVMLGTVLFCLIYGASDEFHQSFVPGRTASLADLAADAFGALLTCLGWRRRCRKPAAASHRKS